MFNLRKAHVAPSKDKRTSLDGLLEKISGKLHTSLSTLPSS